MRGGENVEMGFAACGKTHFDENLISATLPLRHPSFGRKLFFRSKKRKFMIKSSHLPAPIV
jgi:hypothetical protein